MSANKDQVKCVRIKTGVLKRSQKDHVAYTKELQKLRDRLQKWQSEGKDKHDINAVQNQIDETVLVLATCQPKIELAMEDIQNVMAGYEEGP